MPGTIEALKGAGRVPRLRAAEQELNRLRAELRYLQGMLAMWLTAKEAARTEGRNSAEKSYLLANYLGEERRLVACAQKLTRTGEAE